MISKDVRLLRIRNYFLNFGRNCDRFFPISLNIFFGSSIYKSLLFITGTTKETGRLGLVLKSTKNKTQKNAGRPALFMSFVD